MENIIQPFLRTQTTGRTKPKRVLYSSGVGRVLGRGHLWTVPVSQYPDLAVRHMLWGLDSAFFYLVPLCCFHFSVTFLFT